jgi:hypothetical protein
MRAENPRAESTRKSTRVERAKYPVRLRYSRDFRVPGGEDNALESSSDVPLLDKMLPTLSKLQNTKVVVAGYTDNVPTGAKLKAKGVSNNLALSQNGPSRTVSETFTVTNDATGQTRQVTLTGRGVNRLHNDIGTDRVLGHVGADLNISLLPISGFLAKLLMSSRICQTTTLYRLTLTLDSPSK